MHFLSLYFVFYFFCCVVLKHFQSYSDPEEPEISLSGDSLNAATDPSVALPLDDSALTHNLGIPLIVVCCKVITVSIYIMHSVKYVYYMCLCVLHCVCVCVCVCVCKYVCVLHCACVCVHACACLCIDTHMCNVLIMCVHMCVCCAHTLLSGLSYTRCLHATTGLEVWCVCLY